MAIADGTYEIIPAINTRYCLNVHQNLDSATNIAIQPRSGADGQKFTTISTSSGTQISAPLTGRCMEVENGKIADGTNIRTWEDNNSRAQRWDITADGKSITVDGKSYSTYIIYYHGTKYCADVHVNTKNFNLSDVRLHSHKSSGDNNQRWAFVPIGAFTNPGVYKIVSAHDDGSAKWVLDVEGGSHSDGAKVEIAADDGSKEQRWIVSENDDSHAGAAGTLTITNVGSGKVLYNKDGNNNGGDVVIKTAAWNSKQYWLADRSSNMSTMTISGQSYPTYKINSAAAEGQTLLLDASGIVTYDQDDYSAGYWENQRWCFVPDSADAGNIDTEGSLSYDSSIPTPTNLQLLDGNNDFEPIYAIEESAKYYELDFSWYCNYNNFQTRGRYRKKAVGESTYGAWTGWKSLDDGLGGNEGWIDSSKPVDIQRLSGDQVFEQIVLPDGYWVDGSSVYAVEAQLEVRGWDVRSTTSSIYDNLHEYYVHGPSASKIFTMVFKPTVYVNSAVLNGRGVTINYTGTLNDGGCTANLQLKVDDATKDYIQVRQDSLNGASGSVLAHCRNFYQIPTGKCYVKFSIAKDVESNIVSKRMTITDAPNRQTQEIEYSQTEYGTYLIMIPDIDPDKDEVNIFVAADNQAVALVHLRSTGDDYAIYECVPPFNKELTLLIWIQRHDGTWDALSKNLNPINDESLPDYVWTFEGGACVLALNTDKPGATQSDSLNPKYESYEIISRKRVAYRSKETVERNVSVTGVVTDLAPEMGTWDSFDALLNAHHATFRNHRGEVMPVFITGIERPDELYEYTKITVSQYEESL